MHYCNASKKNTREHASLVPWYQAARFYDPRPLGRQDGASIGDSVVSSASPALNVHPNASLPANHQQTQAHHPFLAPVHPSSVNLRNEDILPPLIRNFSQSPAVNFPQRQGIHMPTDSRLCLPRHFDTYYTPLGHAYQPGRRSAIQELIEVSQAILGRVPIVSPMPSTEMPPIIRPGSLRAVSAVTSAPDNVSETSPESNRLMLTKHARHNRMVLRRSRNHGTGSYGGSPKKEPALTKQESKLVKNRLSVQRCRAKKKARADNLQMERSALSAENPILRAVCRKVARSRVLQRYFTGDEAGIGGSAVHMDAPHQYVSLGIPGPSVHVHNADTSSGHSNITKEEDCEIKPAVFYGGHRRKDREIVDTTRTMIDAFHSE